ncbi:glycosyltransferase 87 family protein [Oryzobacter telluris]|uniref:glycosyltransferase 87 family protein n=1 Tax=Oryzobacter telluris TaxID=3149179 RepID=UPI00370D8C12
MLAAARRLAPNATMAVLVVVAVAVRWSVLDVESGDFHAFLDPWYTHLAQRGFAGLGDDFSNYNTPYLVLLWAATHLPLPELVAVKAVSVAFEVLLAVVAFRVVGVVRPGSVWWPRLVAGALLLLPTVVMNGAAWGQCDAVYDSLVLGSLYLLITRRPWWACALFGLALAFKLQAVFFLPVLVLLLLTGRQGVVSLTAVPAAFLAALVPAMVAGRGLLDQLAVYPAQVSGASSVGVAASGRVGPRGGGGGRGGPPVPAGAGAPPPDLMAGGVGSGAGRPGGGPGGDAEVWTGHAFTANAPTPYAWLPADAGQAWKVGGLVVAAVVGLAFGVWLLRRRRALTPGEMVLVAAAVTLVIPWLLPEMHERYFFLAEVLLVVAVAADLRALVPATVLQAASATTYLAYLRSEQVVPLGASAALAAVAVVAVAVLAVVRLGSPDPKRGHRSASPPAPLPIT